MLTIKVSPRVKNTFTLLAEKDRTKLEREINTLLKNSRNTLPSGSKQLKDKDGYFFIKKPNYYIVFKYEGIRQKEIILEDIVSTEHLQFLFGEKVVKPATKKAVVKPATKKAVVKPATKKAVVKPATKKH